MRSSPFGETPTAPNSVDISDPPAHQLPEHRRSFGPRRQLAQPFTAPAVNPATKRSTKKEYRSATGSDPSSDAAISSPQKKSSPRISSLVTPTEMVLAMVSFMKISE